MLNTCIFHECSMITENQVQGRLTSGVRGQKEVEEELEGEGMKEVESGENLEVQYGSTINLKK